MTQKSHVHCTVDNCNWWAQPNLCVAEKLLIVSDDFARDLPSEMDVEQTEQIISQKGLSPVKECYESACKTFVPREKYLSG
ncbi:MAG: DUF1540 domain-containing protein, partial [Bacillota bacterium]